MLVKYKGILKPFKTKETEIKVTFSFVKHNYFKAEEFFEILFV